MEKFVGKLNTYTFNVLIQVICTYGNMKETRFVFNTMNHRFVPNTQTFNVFLCEFHEDGNSMQTQIHFREMTRRSFSPNIVTYNIFIYDLCKGTRTSDVLELFRQMKKVITVMTFIIQPMLHDSDLEKTGLACDSSTWKVLGTDLARLGIQDHINLLQCNARFLSKMIPEHATSPALIAASGLTIISL